MKEPGDVPLQLYRIWIVGYDDWQPSLWHDVPPRSIALEPADAMVLSAVQARFYLEGFNSRMLRQARRMWAVAVPVVIRYEGDPRAGESVVGHQF